MIQTEATIKNEQISPLCHLTYTNHWLTQHHCHEYGKSCNTSANSSAAK